MKMRKTTLALFLGLGLIAGGCWGEKESASTATIPAADAATRARLRADLAGSHQSASDAQIDCFTDSILSQVGYDRFAELVGIAMQEQAGGRAKSARSEAESGDMKKLESLGAECGVPVG